VLFSEPSIPGPVQQQNSAIAAADRAGGIDGVEAALDG
jgi:hypothetical protein